VTSDFLRATARYLFFSALVAAPWMYGGTTKESIVWINWFLAVAIGLWAVSEIGRRLSRSGRTAAEDSHYTKERTQTTSAVTDRRHRWALIFATLSILLLGWWMVANATFIYDSEFFLFIPVRRLLSQAPGTVDYAISVAWMVRATLLIGAMWMVVDLSQDQKWLLRLWWTIGIAGGSIALLGLLQKATGAEMIYWQPAPVRDVKTFFATYYYHANAGAFLNLAWPATIGLALRAFQKHEHPGVRALWLSFSVITIGAVAANTSRMAHLIAAGIAIAITVMFAPAIVRQLSKAELKIAIVGAVSVLLAIFAVAQASHLDQPLARWQALGENLPMDARWVVSKAAIGAVPDAALLGFGPGTFRVIFPYYTGGLGDRAHGVWRFLHEDYLQTLLEWGWLGAALWAFIFFGGILAGVRALSRYASHWTPRRRLVLRLAIVALCGVALHALIDFPLQIMSIQLYAAVYVGLCWGSGRWGECQRSEVGGRTSEFRGQRRSRMTDNR
jgi:O-antigen ligase